MHYPYLYRYNIEYRCISKEPFQRGFGGCELRAVDFVHRPRHFDKITYISISKIRLAEPANHKSFSQNNPPNHYDHKIFETIAHCNFPFVDATTSHRFFTQTFLAT